MSPDETTAVVIYTDSFRISGRIALMPGARLTDFVRNAPPFIAVTDASVTDRAGKYVLAAEFLDVGAAWIELIVPTLLLRVRPAKKPAAKKAAARKKPTRRG